jgi:hypothetical protein
MLPAPAAIAAAPITSSRPSWNPAVPPPPVTGAWVGMGLGDGLGLGVTVVVMVWVGVTVTVVVPEPGDVLPLAGLLVSPAPEEVSELMIVKEDSEGGVELLPEHAERARIPSMIRAPQPMAVGLALSAVVPMAVRTFIEPPHARFSPTPAADNRHRKESARPTRSFACVSRRQPPATVMLRLMGDANTQWRAHHSNIRLRQ